MEVKDDKINIVKFGEKEGEITGWIPGADGAKYQVKYEFTKKAKRNLHLYVKMEQRYLLSLK